MKAVDYTKIVGRISGKVVDLAGNPQVGVTLRITKTLGGGLAHTETQVTAADGTYMSKELPLGSGGANLAADYRVKVISPTPSLFAPGDPGHLLGPPPGTLDTTVTLTNFDQPGIDFMKIR